MWSDLKKKIPEQCLPGKDYRWEHRVEINGNGNMGAFWSSETVL